MKTTEKLAEQAEKNRIEAIEEKVQNIIANSLYNTEACRRKLKRLENGHAKLIAKTTQEIFDESEDG